LHENDRNNWMRAFPVLEKASDPAWQQAAAKVQLADVPRGAVLFRDGDVCAGYVMVVEGSVRVQKIDPEGREIVLYRVEQGQTCMLTTTCLLGGQAYPAEGIAETNVSLAILPTDAFDAAMAASESFRRFIFAAIGIRISDLMLLIEDVAFGRMDQRLARLLVTRSSHEKGATLTYTHQGLATELGTAREVVSRLLKDFERRHLVELRRGQIEVLDVAALTDLAAD